MYQSLNYRQAAILSIFLLLITFSEAQQFIKSENPGSQIKYIKYYNPKIQIVVQKTISDTGIYYEIGLMVTKNSIERDYFMNRGGEINFSDGTNLNFNEEIQTNYLYSGQHQAHIRHRLSIPELRQLQTKKINSFKILDVSNKLDKWQQSDLIKVFEKIEQE